VTLSTAQIRPDIQTPPKHAAAATNTVAVEFIYHTGITQNLNNRPFLSGYTIDGVAEGTWREAFNSDAALYGGWNDGNGGADLSSTSGRCTAVLP
jgi:Alpha amylase, C-terminal all-beta domain